MLGLNCGAESILPPGDPRLYPSGAASCGHTQPVWLGRAPGCFTSRLGVREPGLAGSGERVILAGREGGKEEEEKDEKIRSAGGNPEQG